MPWMRSATIHPSFLALSCYHADRGAVETRVIRIPRAAIRPAYAKLKRVLILLLAGSAIKSAVPALPPSQAVYLGVPTGDPPWPLVPTCFL